MGDMIYVRGTPTLRGIEITQVQSQVFDQCKWPNAGSCPSRDVPGTEISVNIFNTESGICKRTVSNIGMQLSHRSVHRLARWVLVGTDDIGFTFHTHRFWSHS